MKKVYYLYLLSFISAFLLFQIELIIAKLFLPKFGGSYLVWGACMVFFQFALLLGYLYSHLVITIFGMYRYRYLHTILILLPLFFFPGRPLKEIAAHTGFPLVIDIFMQLSIKIGMAFFALSTISIVTQSWLAHSNLPENRNPYVLYAVSNAGSFMGLLSYPFFFESYFDLDTQLTIWRLLYFLFLLIYLVSLWIIDYSDRNVPCTKPFDKHIFTRQYKLTDEAVIQKLYWFLLSAVSCVLFLSVTNVITYEITPCPLLWVIPLCIYLLSFVLIFRNNPLYPKWITDKFPLIMGFSVLIFFFAQGKILPISPQLITFLLSLLAFCLFCQYELYESRPKEKKDLTIFYVIVSLGGFSGSLFVTWIAPGVFTSPIEFLIGLFLVCLALSLKKERTRLNFLSLRMIAYAIIFLISWPFVFKQYNVAGVTLILFSFGYIFRQLNQRPSMLALLLMMVFLLAPFVEDYWSKEGKTIRSYRNYYGIYRITVSGGVLQLINGTTLHGIQYIKEDRAARQEPLSYYHRGTPVGKLLIGNHFATRQIGIVGLGVGTISAYGKTGEEMDFFELDPDLALFVNLFDYLKNSRAKVNYYYDDARLGINKTPLGHYDILIVDAFSGDSIPVHLLTTDAIQQYRDHLKEKGLILFHISNRYLDLTPVMFKNAEAVGAFALLGWNEAQSPVHLASRWVAFTWDKNIKETLISKLEWKENPIDSKTLVSRPWTDKYSNVISILNIASLLDSIRHFMPFLW